MYRNDNAPLQVSTNNDCEVTLVTAALVQAIDECPGPKNLIARDDQNNIITTGVDIITFDASPYVGQVFSITIEDQTTQTICVGFAEIMDFVSPVFAADCMDVVMGCMGDTSVEAVGTPTVTDNCGGIATLTHEDVISMGNCLTDIVTHIERTWTAIDSSGNSTTCIQNIDLEKPDINDTVFPDDITISCDNPNTGVEITGTPTIDGGSIMNGDICNLLTTFVDDTIHICGNIELQIIRSWTIVDNCSNFIIDETQIISIMDEVKPTLDCIDDIVVPANAGECYATVSLQVPDVSDNCDANPSITVTTSYGETGFGPHQQVPMGTHTIEYVATDQCGNADTCFVTLTVVDNQIPVAVCNDELIVSISTGGLGIVNAISFDEGSNDNCNSELFYKVRRVITGICDNANGDDSPNDGYQEWFDDQVYFCCEEMEQDSIMVFLHVYEVDPGPGPVDPTREAQGGDLFDHYNECQTAVTVQDQISPYFTYCPPHQIIDCHDDFSDLSVFGSPIADDNCTFTVDSVEVVNINECGIGTITRTFTVTDLVGLTASCTQVITIVNNNPFSGSNITWPPTYETSVCGAAVEPEDLPELYQFPTFDGDECSNVTFHYEDALYVLNMPACYKILRKWTIIDWCNFDPEYPENGGQFTHTQIIKVLDHDAPVLSDCPENVVVAVDNSCIEAVVILTPITAEDCADNVTITNNSPYAYANGADASGVYPKGTFLVTFTATDHCGNASTCQVSITVEDQTAPSIICITGLSIDLTLDGDEATASVDVEAFVQSVVDNCTDPVDVLRTIRLGNGSNTTPPAATQLDFTCADFGIQQVEVWVEDEVGNFDFCLTYIDVQDNGEICPQVEFNMIAGTISTPLGENIEDVMVYVDGGEEGETLTSDDGHFEFAEVPMGLDYTLIPERTDDVLNGISTIDIILISKHILGVQALDSPYKILASDINNSNSVTTVDMIKLRKLVLGIDDELPDGVNSWRFIDADFDFPDPTNPWSTPIPGLLSLDNLEADEMQANFIGIKIGDVNDTATPNALLGLDERMAYGEFGITVENKTIEEGETVVIDFMARDMDKLAGFQFTMNYDPNAFEFVSVSSADLPAMDETNIGTNRIEEGMLTFSWNQMAEAPISDEMILFSITFNSNANAELQDLLFINSRVIEAEAYTLDEDMLDLGLVFLSSSSASVDDGNELYQNRPNPFSDDTIIPFKLSESGDVSLTVYDLAGRRVYQTESYFDSGYNEIVIGKQDLGITGVMYYELRAGGWKDTRKMILSE